MFRIEASVTMHSRGGSRRSSTIKKRASVKGEETKYVDEWSSLRVYVRVKPPVEGSDVCLAGDAKRITVSSKTFTYEKVFWPECLSQSVIYERVASPLLKAALSGYNACLLAYGQTGSGKTYSMMGHDFSCEGELSGLIPRFCENLLIAAFKTENNASYAVEMSYFEIYKEEIFDLIAPNTNRNKLRVREHPVTGPYVEGLASHPIKDLHSVKVLLKTGNARRMTSSTIKNDRSSRSHSIVQLNIVKRFDDTMVHSKVNLVDLAGSEKISQPSITETHYKEGLSINRSLLSLGKVITCLAESKGGFAPYRESVLTWLLKESLGGNSCTSILATVSPEPTAIEETLSTLRYACRARQVVNNVVLNEDPQHKLVRELRKEVERLKSIKGCDEDDSALGLQRLNVEKTLQKELSRLSADLASAEERKRELERRMNSFINDVKTSDVTVYKSNFMENLKEILDNSFEDNVSNMASVYIKDVENSVHVLRTFCENNCNADLYKSEISSLLSIMEGVCNKLTTSLVTKS